MRFIFLEDNKNNNNNNKVIIGCNMIYVMVRNVE
jgi:hypothetical protein